MNLHPPIQCLGLNYRTAPLALREELNGISVVSGTTSNGTTCRNDLEKLAILTTCNRVELYASLAPCDDEVAFSTLLETLLRGSKISKKEISDYLYFYTGLDAVEHLCRVASGLDSMVLGETQILGQVSSSYQMAVGKNLKCPVLKEVFQTAIRTGKRARAETAISRNPASVCSAAIDFAHVVVGDLSKQHVLVLGAGEMAAVAVKVLQNKEVGRLTVANRTFDRALDLVARNGGDACRFEDLDKVLGEVDVVLAATGAQQPVLARSTIERVIQLRDERPLVLIDIALPRDVSPDVRDLPGVHLFDMDDLQSQISQAILQREKEVPRVEQIISEELSKFDNWAREVRVAPLITALRQKAENIRQKELERMFDQLGDVDEQVVEQVQHLSRALVNKLLHHPTILLRKEASCGCSKDYSEAVRYLFALHE